MKTISGQQFESICRDAGQRPVSSRVATGNEKAAPVEDYLYTVWYRVAERLGCESPRLRQKVDSWTDAYWLREEIYYLVAQREDPVFHIGRILDRHKPAGIGVTYSGFTTDGEKWPMRNTEITTPSPKDSPFTFDVWQCPVCQWAMSNAAYSASGLNYDCPNCSSKKLSEFELRKARRS